MQVNQEFKSGDEDLLKDFIIDRRDGESLVIVAGNPRITSIGAEGQLFVDKTQHTAVKSALDIYNFSIISVVLKELEGVGRSHALVEALIRENNWPAYVRGGNSKKATLPLNLLRNRKFRGFATDFLPHFAQLVKDAKEGIRLVTQLDHDGGSSVHKFLTGQSEATLQSKHGGSRNTLKRAVETGELSLRDLTIRSFASSLRQGVFSPALEGSLAHSNDVHIVPEGLIRGYMNNLATEQDWGEEVNFTLKSNLTDIAEPYCTSRDIYAYDSAGEMVVNCPGVVAGTLGLVARDIVGTKEGKRGRILAFKEEDGRRVNGPEENGGTQFYNERIPNAELAPARLVMTPIRDPHLVGFAQFGDPNRCR